MVGDQTCMPLPSVRRVRVRSCSRTESIRQLHTGYRTRAPQSLITFMDKKSIIIVIVSFLVLMLWVPLTNYIWPPKPAPKTTNQVAFQTNVTPTQAVANLTNRPTETPLPRTPLVSGTASEELVHVETPEARFIFSSHGGGLKTAELKNYPEVITCN